MWNFVWLLAETEAFRMTSLNYQICLQLPVLFLSIIYYNVDEMRVVNTDRLWICRKINFQLEALATVTMAISSCNSNNGAFEEIVG
jgi:hypothetical protein